MYCETTTQLALIFFILLPFTITDEYMANKYLEDCSTTYLSLANFLLISGLFKMGQLLFGFLYKLSQEYVFALAVLLFFIVASFGINIFGIILFADVYKNHNCTINLLVYTMFSICIDILMLLWYGIYMIKYGFNNDYAYMSLDEINY